MATRRTIVDEYSFTEKDLQAVIDGNFAAFERLKRQSNQTILENREKLDELILTTGTLAHILNAYWRGELAPEILGEWASFIRWGSFMSPESERIRSVDINIEYDPSFEDEIIEIIGRLDEIGDIIDGEVNKDEVESMLKTIPQ